MEQLNRNGGAELDAASTPGIPDVVPRTIEKDNASTPLATPPSNGQLDNDTIYSLGDGAGAPEGIVLDPQLASHNGRYKDDESGAFVNAGYDSLRGQQYLPHHGAYSSVPSLPHERLPTPPLQLKSFPYTDPARSDTQRVGRSPILGHTSASAYARHEFQHSLHHDAARPILPPIQESLSNTSSDFAWLSDHRAKRLRFSSNGDSHGDSAEVGYVRSLEPDRANYQYRADAQSPSSSLLTPYTGLGTMTNTPATPGSSIASEELYGRAQSKRPSLGVQSPPNVRRLSVNSLLTGPPRDEDTPGRWRIGSSRYPKIEKDGFTIYGYDHGHPDLDIPKNDDANAIAFASPATARVRPRGVHGTSPEPDARDYTALGSQVKDIAFERGGYYAQPVPVRIPIALEPLPPQLLQNPMNLLYFHHFLNHTARILVPHDCPENPLRHVLPQMAVRNPNLLNLLLAYSASHRARLLDHPEPANRIAMWVQDVFPSLRRAIKDSNEQVSDANLATAIMLASLEIVSPNTFEVPISWQDHLQMARKIIGDRGGPRYIRRTGKVPYFLSCWFAYLDVLGTLSGNKYGQSLRGIYWTDDDPGTEDDFQIDCLLGFTNRCIGLLAEIAELARVCDQQRAELNSNSRLDWSPDQSTLNAAMQLKGQLKESREHVNGCSHRHPEIDQPDDAAWDSHEIYATNEAFHWAGLIYLERRVLGRPSSGSEVQDAIRAIVGALDRVRKGSTAEACLIFPMFMAGCEAIDCGHRDKIMERLRNVEGWGMTQVCGKEITFGQENVTDMVN
ncbi:hypothetical protein LTR50_001001 [Elasticomyces elasticus]|nr:hypothetical protein LTR50_001001 [Elasticomyces elasticus]